MGPIRNAAALRVICEYESAIKAAAPRFDPSGAAFHLLVNADVALILTGESRVDGDGLTVQFVRVHAETASPQRKRMKCSSPALRSGPSGSGGGSEPACVAVAARAIAGWDRCSRSAPHVARTSVAQRGRVAAIHDGHSSSAAASTRRTKLPDRNSPVARSASMSGATAGTSPAFFAPRSTPSVPRTRTPSAPAHARAALSSRMARAPGDAAAHDRTSRSPRPRSHAATVG